MRNIMLGLAMAGMLVAGILVGSISQNQAIASADMFTADMAEMGAATELDMVQNNLLQPNGQGSAFAPERLRKLALMGVINTIAEETDLTVSEIRAQVKDDQTLAEIAEAGGTTSASVQQHMIDEASMLLHRAVTNEFITERRANIILDGLTTRLPDLMNDAELADRMVQAEEQFKDRISERMTVRGLSAASDLTVRDILARMRAGESVGEIAQSLGASSDEVADAATPILVQHLERPLQTGIIREQEKDAFLEEFPERVTAVLEQTNQE
jgi:hypothetical protein